MKILNIGLILSVVVFVFVGCGTKRQYFEPANVSWKIDYDGSLPAKIVDVTRSGATLENGQIITKDGLQNIKVPKGYIYLNNSNGEYLAASKCGELVILNRNSKIIYSKKFSECIASANIKNGNIALVSASNRLYLIDYKSDKILFDLQQEDVYALDSRIAAPYFLSSLIVYPTLDGKLVIVDSKSLKAVRSVVISNEEFFGNVIYLNVLNNRLVAATKKRVISINPKSMGILEKDIKDVVVLKNRIFVFTKDGEVILCDADLNVLKSKKFKFAIFAGAIYGDFIYMIERGGYLIATDADLISTNIYKLPDEIDSYLYFNKNTMYFEDKYFKLSSKKR